MENIRITSLLGNGQKLDGGAMFGNAPKPLWERYYKADELNRIDLACRCMLIQIDDVNILCETGIGNFMPTELAERFGVENPKQNILLESLDRIHLNHEEIHYVVLSHLHFDHAGGLLPSSTDIRRGNNGLLFPKAKYIVGKDAMARADHPHRRDRASFIPDLQDKLRQSGRLQIVEGPTCPGFFEDRINFIYSDGHTPGQMHLVIRGNETSVVFAGDLVPGTAWLNLPMTMGYDRFPERLIDEKEFLYKSIQDKDWMIFYTHDPKVAVSKIRVNEKGKFVPDKEMPTVSSWAI